MPALKKKHQSVNLLPREEEERTLGSRIVHWLLTTFRFLVITVELLVIIGFLSRFFLDSQNSDLTDEINQKKALIASYLPFEDEFKTTQKRIEIAKNHYEGQVLFSSVIDTITKNITSGMQLISIQNRAGSVEIDIQSANEQNINNFAESLKNNEILTNVHVTLIESLPNSNILEATLIGNIKGTSSSQTVIQQ